MRWHKNETIWCITEAQISLGLKWVVQYKNNITLVYRLCVVLQPSLIPFHRSEQQYQTQSMERCGAVPERKKECSSNYGQPLQGLNVAPYLYVLLSIMSFKNLTKLYFSTNLWPTYFVLKPILFPVFCHKLIEYNCRLCWAECHVDSSC